MIPGFDADGRLPAGEHDADWDEVTSTFGWNPWRQTLLSGLQLACGALAVAGCTRLWLDGSFVTDKEQPGDYDACWDWRGVDRSLLDPVLLDYSKTGRDTISAKYLGDVLIAGTEAASGLAFVDFFQQARGGGTKGIIRLNPKEVP